MPDDSSGSDALLKWGTLAIAVAGFVQYWLIAAWRKYIRRGEVSIHESGRIEIGYSNFGPTVYLHGALRATNAQAFVSSMQATIVRERDQSRHEFEWLVFREARVILDPAVELAVELPVSFLVRPEHPHRYSIVFSDVQTREELESDVIPINVLRDHAINEYFNAKEAANEPADIPDDELAREMHDRACKHEVYNKAYESITRRMYWEPGGYALTLTVTSAKPSKPVCKRWRFHLSKSDSDRLKNNCIVLLRSMYGLGDRYGFVGTTYQDHSPYSSGSS